MTTTVKGKKTAKARSAKKRVGMVDPASLAPAYIDPAQKALVDAFCASKVDTPYTIDDYLREKHAGIDAENAMKEQIRKEIELTGREWSVDDYLREKHAGVDAANAMWEQIKREKGL